MHSEFLCSLYQGCLSTSHSTLYILQSCAVLASVPAQLHGATPLRGCIIHKLAVLPPPPLMHSPIRLPPQQYHMQVQIDVSEMKSCCQHDRVCCLTAGRQRSRSSRSTQPLHCSGCLGGTSTATLQENPNLSGRQHSCTTESAKTIQEY